MTIYSAVRQTIHFHSNARRCLVFRKISIETQLIIDSKHFHLNITNSYWNVYLMCFGHQLIISRTPPINWIVIVSEMMAVWGVTLTRPYANRASSLNTYMQIKWILNLRFRLKSKWSFLNFMLPQAYISNVWRRLWL